MSFELLAQLANANDRISALERERDQAVARADKAEKDLEAIVDRDREADLAHVGEQYRVLAADYHSLRAQLATAIGIIAKLRGNHPDNFSGYGVGQRKDGDTTLSMWHEADAFLSAHQRGGR